MGYCMDMQECSFHIPAEKFGEALAAIKALMIDTESMSGGSYQGGMQTGKWFSWVHTESVWSAEGLPEALSAWRWKAYLSERGDIDYLSFTGEKSGDDRVLFSAIAPYVTDGSYISMRGEDGFLWRWFFQNGECSEQEGQIVWV